MPLDSTHGDEGSQGLRHSRLNTLNDRFTESIWTGRGDEDIRQPRDRRQIRLAGETEFITHSAKCFQVAANYGAIKLIDRAPQLNKVDCDIDTASRNHRLYIFLQRDFERSEVQWCAPVNI